MVSDKLVITYSSSMWRSDRTGSSFNYESIRLDADSAFFYQSKQEKSAKEKYDNRRVLAIERRALKQLMAGFETKLKLFPDSASIYLSRKTAAEKLIRAKSKSMVDSLKVESERIKHRFPPVEAIGFTKAKLAAIYLQLLENGYKSLAEAKNETGSLLKPGDFKFQFVNYSYRKLVTDIKLQFPDTTLLVKQETAYGRSTFKGLEKNNVDSCIAVIQAVFD